MRIKAITDFLEEIAPLHLQEGYDNAGLIVGNHDSEVQSILVSLDTTEKVIDEAIQLGCNLVVSHHPIIFQGLKRLNGYHYVERAIIKAVKNDVAIYAIHTNLDNVLHHGVNEKIAAKLGLENVRILRIKDQETLGSGLIGLLPQPLGFDDFARHLTGTMQLTGFRHTEVIGHQISKIALCGGSGRFLLEDAISVKADVFISADFKYHEYFEANEQITIIDIGHFESERFTIELLHQLITGKFTTFAAYCTKVNTNPLKYRY